MRDEDKINPGHGAMRGLLRLVGPLLFIVGLGFTAVGFGSFFSAFGGAGFPSYFWCAFIGLPMMGFGAQLTMVGFMGAIARYQVGEIAPVGKDAFNYLADGTRGGVKTTATAIAAGLAEGLSPEIVGELRCGGCGETNDADASYCKKCGAVLAVSLACPACNESNDPDATFCNHCGLRLHDDP